jgi:hypothetical protein
LNHSLNQWQACAYSAHQLEPCILMFFGRPYCLFGPRDGGCCAAKYSAARGWRATEMKHNTESHIGFRVDTVAMRVKHQGTLDIVAWVSERACNLYRSEQRVRIWFSCEHQEYVSGTPSCLHPEGVNNALSGGTVQGVAQATAILAIGYAHSPHRSPSSCEIVAPITTTGARSGVPESLWRAYCVLCAP